VSEEAPLGPPVRAAPDHRSIGPRDTDIAAWARAFFSHPNRVVTIFWAGGGVATVSVIPLERWPAASLLTLTLIGGLCFGGCAIRLLAGERLPRSALHFDVAIATVFASALAAVGTAGHINFANLYIWIAVFAFMYFRLPVALIELVACGVAYAVVLTVGPRAAEPVAAWLAVFGTLAVAGGVTFLLVTFLRRATLEDPLTGLANRRSFDERLEEEIQRSRRSGATLSVVMADLDGFKAINDRGGHAAGDQLLRDLAAGWRREVRGSGDVIARLGGDEFGVLGPGSDALGLRRLAKRLGAALPEGVTGSFGVASWNRTESGSELLRRADTAMYQQKRRRHNPVGGADIA